MSDVSNKTEQERVLNDIFSRYDDDTKKLYLRILKFYNDRGTSMPKSKVREEIMERIKGVVK